MHRACFVVIFQFCTKLCLHLLSAGYQWIMQNGGLSSRADYGPYLGADGFCHANQVTRESQPVPFTIVCRSVRLTFSCNSSHLGSREHDDNLGPVRLCCRPA